MTPTGHARTVDEMIGLGRATAATVRPATVIALVGDLAAGKTHWTKGLVAALGCPAQVTSPTFSIVHEYRGGSLPVFHFDFYRLDQAAELIALGWDEYLDENGVTVVEWADKFPELLPPDTRWLHFTVNPDGSRTLAPWLPVIARSPPSGRHLAPSGWQTAPDHWPPHRN